jgi:catechol 2,3-dioxygenase-like lactoylglutathione lyase family enzyme
MSSPVLVHVGVRASDIERTIRFWRDGLGLHVAATIPPDSADPRGYDLTDGHHNFRVFQHNGPERPANVTGLLDYLHVGVAVEDLGAAARRLHDLGFHIYWDGVSGGKAIDAFDPSTPPSESFKVEDPDGITVDVTASRDQWPGVGF